MEPETEFQTELDSQIHIFYLRITKSRDNGLTQNELEARTADFEMQWNDEIIKCQKYEAAGRKIEARENLDDDIAKTRQQTQEIDNKRLTGMQKPEDQVAYHESGGRPASVLEERETARRLYATFVQIDKATEQKYTAIRYAMSHAMMNIEKGQEPNFIETLNQYHKEKPHAAKLSPEQISALKNAIARKRGNDFDPEI